MLKQYASTHNRIKFNNSCQQQTENLQRENSGNPLKVWAIL